MFKKLLACCIFYANNTVIQFYIFGSAGVVTDFCFEEILKKLRGKLI